MTRPEQKIEERQQVEMALSDLRVPYNDLINDEAPDFWLCLQGRKIAIEHTKYNSSKKYRQFEEEWINLRSKIEAWNFGGNLYLDFRDQAPIKRRDRKSFKKELKSLLKDHQRPEAAVETTAGSSCTDSADLQRDEPLSREDKNLIAEEILPSFDEAQNTETVYKDFSNYPCLQQYLNSLGLTKADITTVGSNLDGGWFGVTYDEISNIMCKKGRGYE